jgi:hypothetical protein
LYLLAVVPVEQACEIASLASSHNVEGKLVWKLRGQFTGSITLCHYYKNTNHEQMHKESFIINGNTLLHVSTLLGHLQGEPFVVVTLRLHFIVE